MAESWQFAASNEKAGIRYRVWVPTIQWLAFDVSASDEDAAREHAKYLANKGWRADNEGEREYDWDASEAERK